MKIHRLRGKLGISGVSKKDIFEYKLDNENLIKSLQYYGIELIKEDVGIFYVDTINNRIYNSLSLWNEGVDIELSMLINLLNGSKILILEELEELDYNDLIHEDIESPILYEALIYA